MEDKEEGKRLENRHFAGAVVDVLADEHQQA